MCVLPIFLFFLDDLDNLDASLSRFFSLMIDRTQLAASLHVGVMGIGGGGLFGDSENVRLDDSEGIDEIATAEASDVFGGNFLSVGFEIGF